jgi:hypothetical protein
MLCFEHARALLPLAVLLQSGCGSGAGEGGTATAASASQPQAAALEAKKFWDERDGRQAGLGEGLDPRASTNREKMSDRRLRASASHNTGLPPFAAGG